MTKKIHDSKNLVFYGGTVAELLEEIRITVAEIESSGGTNITVETSTEHDYGDEQGVLEFSFQRDETDQEKRARYDVSRQRKDHFLREAKALGYKVQPE